MKRLAILGASGHGKVVADTAECCGWDCIEFFDDAWPNIKTNTKWRVNGDGTMLVAQKNRFTGVVVAIGNNRIRHLKIIELQSAGVSLVTLIHPAATVSQYTKIGAGVVIFPGAIVNIDASVGTGVILNTACSIDHDCILGDAVHISPGAHLAGGVQIGRQSWVGMGACIRELVCVGERVMVGAGATVISNLPDDVTACGTPAKIIPRKPDTFLIPPEE